MQDNRTIMRALACFCILCATPRVCGCTIVKRIDVTSCGGGLYNEFGCAGEGVWVADGCKVRFQCPSLTTSSICESGERRNFSICSCSNVTSAFDDDPAACQALPPPSATQRLRATKPASGMKTSAALHFGLLQTHTLKVHTMNEILGICTHLRRFSAVPVQLHLIYSGAHLTMEMQLQLRQAGVELVLFRVLDLPVRIRCLYELLTSCMSGGAPVEKARAFMLKPLAAWVLPSHVPRIVLLDMDVALLRAPHELWANFDRFGDALLGLAREQSTMYTQHTSLARAYNGGVQLLELARMRGADEARYLAAVAAACATHRMIAAQFDVRSQPKPGRNADVRFGALGDQTLYSYLAHTQPSLVHDIGCEWNRQLGSWIASGGSADTAWLRRPDLHACPAQRCAALHANLLPLKCAAMLLRANASCANWHGFIRRLEQPARGSDTRNKHLRLALQLRSCGSEAHRYPRLALARAVRRYYSDCCVPEGGTPSSWLTVPARVTPAAASPAQSTRHAAIVAAAGTRASHAADDAFGTARASASSRRGKALRRGIKTSDAPSTLPVPNAAGPDAIERGEGVRLTYATLVIGKGYLPGVAALACALRTSAFPLVVQTDAQTAPHVKALAAEWAACGGRIRVSLLPAALVGANYSALNYTAAYQRDWSATFAKLYVWTLPFDLVAFIDADVLLQRPVRRRSRTHSSDYRRHCRHDYHHSYGCQRKNRRHRAIANVATTAPISNCRHY
uniref:Uncharacterized protein n=1 Tax=Chrysotila carterae TaxID=13221 RepID=A0A7S4BPS5_CHRCT